MTPHRVVVQTDIHAAVERIWDLVCDVTLLPRFSSELRSAEWAEGFDAPGPGARFLGLNRHPAIGEWTTLSTVVDFESLRTFGWVVGDPEKPAATWRFDLVAADTGCRLHYSAELGPGRSGVTMLIDREPDHADEIIQRRLAQWRLGMTATVAGIKELAESG